MTRLQERAFIALDEWVGIALLYQLHRTHDPLFVPVLVAWIVMVYGISYPLHWGLGAFVARKLRGDPWKPAPWSRVPLSPGLYSSEDRV